MVEAALLLSILGAALAVFVPTFLRRLRTNKIAEASELLQEMSTRTAAYYATSWDEGRVHCLPTAAGPTPAMPSVDPVEVDFSSEEAVGRDTWIALGFQPERPIRYRYQYAPGRAGCDLGMSEPATSITFRAEGDLDGDDVFSTFERRATIDRDGFAPAEALHIDQRTE